MRLISSDSPEYEIAITTSSFVIMPRSPWLASAGCMKNAGVPVEASEDQRYLAEFGALFLMFSVGLEFSLPQLRSMRSIVFGFGGAQVASILALGLAGAFVVARAGAPASSWVASWRCRPPRSSRR